MKAGIVMVKKMNNMKRKIKIDGTVELCSFYGIKLLNQLATGYIIEHLRKIPQDRWLKLCKATQRNRTTFNG